MLIEQHGIESRGRALLMTASDSAGRSMIEVSGDMMMRYALRIGADFKIVQYENHSERAMPRPHAVKFYMAHELERYETVVWIDADCLIAPDAPNIFDEVPDGFGFAAWCGEDKAFTDSNLKRPVYRHGYFNSGVVLTRTAEPFHRAMDLLVRKDQLLSESERKAIMGEQTPFNKAVHELGIPVYDLGPQWNFLLTPERCRKLGISIDIHSAYIVHCAGGVHLELKNPKDRQERADAMHRLRLSLGW